MKRALVASVGVLILALTLALAPSAQRSLVARANLAILDVSLFGLRAFAPKPATLDPVLIGIDDQTLAEFKFPLALWHEHFADLFMALAIAEPRVVGVDVVLPERSYDFVAPGLDIKLLRAIAQLRARSPVVLAQRVDSQGRVRPIHPPFVVAAGGKDALGIDQVPLDADLTVRRFSETSIAASEPVATFAGQVARRINTPVTEGIIDFTRGSEVGHVPMHKVVSWLHEGDDESLRRTFAGRVVLIGTVTHGEDRLGLPLKLAAFDDERASAFRPRQPGVLVHVQTLRSLGSQGLIHSAPTLSVIGATLLCVWPILIAFARHRWASRLSTPASLTLVSLVWLCGLSLLVLVLLYHRIWLAPALPMLVFALALTVFAARAMRERLKLKASLAGQVSPVVMAEIMSENADDRATIKRDVCVLFSDIRGFTTASEHMSPERMTALLQRYFDAMVAEVHAHNGALDKFMGDGMMVLFGAPNRLDNPCAAAVKCAESMLAALTRLNQQIVAEGYAPLAIGIGINYGPVVAGWIGSSQRNNYSAIGDAVNVAARIEGLTKDLGERILVTDAVRQQLAKHHSLADIAMRELGEQAIRGHTPVKVWGVG